jgi:hypothetical protein
LESIVHNEISKQFNSVSTPAATKQKRHKPEAARRYG